MRIVCGKMHLQRYSRFTYIDTFPLYFIPRFIIIVERSLSRCFVKSNEASFYARMHSFDDDNRASESRMPVAITPAMLFFHGK